MSSPICLACDAARRDAADLLVMAVEDGITTDRIAHFMDAMDGERAWRVALFLAGVAAGLVEVHGGWKRTDWQHREIARLLAETVFVDEDTGELDQIGLMEAMPAVYAVLDAGRMEWRVTDLRAAGLTTDGLCKEELVRMTVQILTPAETQ